MLLAPIALFTFKKLEPLKATVAALKKNKLAQYSELVIYSDAPIHVNDIERVNMVRAYLKTITGFKKVTINLATVNKGLANAIIEGVSDLLEQHETVIVMEDDLLCSTNFLAYMNAALNFYKNDPKVFSIAGYSPPISESKNYEYDIYFSKRASSWGWATYKSQWKKVDWQVNDYSHFKHDDNAKKAFNRMGSDLTGMLKKQMKGKIDSWAIRWCFHQFKNELFTVFPTKSKIINIGFIKGATHTKGKSQNLRFTTPLDVTNTMNFRFKPDVIMEKQFINDFIKPYRLTTRLKYKIRTLFNL
ncbi:sugar phosphate nucleotidyltransferase [uncultured Maribacter sp.]|uniref:sugar phosphate nucleotidyltransferase n=1 Tax=uncultured Maribacter sp. TaxID=431308 RepID=UPI002614DC22|nr:sugar phosphate nucleotidyltransferase [uncultured Maribacter sp.]